MTRREELRERYEDALLALLMDEVAVSEGEKALAENKRLQSDPSAEVPEEVGRRCLRTIQKHFAVQSTRRKGQTALKYLKRVAVAALVGAVLFTVAFASSETLRVNTLNLIVEVFDDNTKFVIDNAPPSGIAPKISASWLPDGFSLKEEDSDKVGVNNWCIYENASGDTIQLEYASAAGTVLHVDTEDAETENIQIQGAAALLIQKRLAEQSIDEVHIVWATLDKSAFIEVIATGVACDDVIQVANGVQY